MKVTYEEGKEIAKAHFCGEIGCGKPLVLAIKDDQYDVHCIRHKESTNFVARMSYSQARRQGIPIPLEVESAIEAKEKLKMQEKDEGIRQSPTRAELQRVKGEIEGHLIPGWADKDLGSHQVLSPYQQQVLVVWAEELRLRSDLGHVMAYYGKPYVTVDGLCYHARRQDPNMSFKLEYLSAERRKEIGLADGDYAAICHVYNGRGKMLAERIGIARREDIEEKSKKDPTERRYPILAKRPIEMAENRAMWDAIMDAYPLGLERVSKPEPEGEPDGK